MKTIKHTLNKIASVILITSLLAIACSNDSGMDPEPVEPDPIELSALVSPTPFKAEGNWHLVYEIEVSNQGQEAVEIEQLEVLNGSQRLAMYEGADLADLMLPLYTPLIPTGQKGLIYLWITVAEDSIPTTLRHNIKFAGTSVPESHDVAVDASSPLTLGPPLRGELWLAGDISNSGNHRRFARSFNGSLHVPERFAIDWIRVGPDRSIFSGDPQVNSSYYAHGAELLAVHDGVIVAIKDGISENIPGQVPPQTLETAGGNWILLDMGNNKFAFYAHLIPGSLRVQPGQAVRKGDVLGLLGNSGDSDAPHLHFHVAKAFDVNSSSIANAESLPYVFESFEIQANRPVLGERISELPLDLAVVRFPGTDPTSSLPPEIGVAGDGNLQANLEYIRSQNNVPAVAAVTIRGGEIVDIAAAGLRAHGYPEEVTIDDKWHLASITKSMTSTLAAVLIEQGTLSWETTIADVFPNLVGTMRSEYENVRLDELLSQTGGLNESEQNLPSWDSYFTNTSPIMTQRRQLIAELLTLPPGGQRGVHLYSNVNYHVAGAMFEALTGRSWEELIQGNVFAPLGMNSTGFGPPGTAGQRNQPWGHIPFGNDWQAFDPGDVAADNPAVHGPAGTIHTTLQDVALYMAAHLAGARGNDRLVTKGSFEKLHTPFPGTQYALGWQDLGGGILWHNGTNGRWFAQLVIIPQIDGASFMVTNVGGELGDKVTWELGDILSKRFQAAFGGTN